MHICYLCNEYPPGKHGGVGSFTQTLARAMVARGHEVTVVGIYPASRRGLECDQGVRVVRLPHSPIPRTGFLLNGWRLRQALRRIHRESRIDVLEGPELSLAVIPTAFPAAKVIRMHGGHHFFAVTLGARPRPWRGWQEVRSFGRADALCAVSRYVGETTRGLLHLADRPIEVLPNPVDPALFSPRPGTREEDGLILFVGTVCEKKGVRQLIQAMPRVVAAVPHARLWVVGRDWRDPRTGRSFTAGLRDLLPPGLADQVEFRGSVEHAALPDLLARAQVCVYPSHMEALPVAWLEGLAMGKAVVASQTGPGPEVIEDGVSGLLCDPHDPSSIADRIITLLKDPNLRRRLGARARERVVGRFSVEALAACNETFYRRCVGGHADA